MPLAPAAILELAAACAPAVAPETLLAVARAESALDPLAIGVNGGGTRPAPRTVDQAVDAAGRLIAAGRDIDLGLGQINVRNLRWLGLSLADAFDPCRNLAAAAQVLTEGYSRAARRYADEPRRLAATLSIYNTGHLTRGLANGYVARVAAAAGLPADPPGPASSPASEAPPAGWDVFGRARLRRAEFAAPSRPISGDLP